MSNSQEQSLDENASFSAIPDSSPQFYHCEPERCALEILLSTGPKAFHAKLGLENIDAFLSPQEVVQLSAWAQECSNELTDDNVPGVDEDSSRLDSLSIHYWPACSDTPPPDLELGWPQKDTWFGAGEVHVYTSPPAPQAPQIREVVRKMIQGAHKVIAIVTDTLTDNTVIADLCLAASRAIPVYVILNHRSNQTSDIPQQLKHENIRIRVLGGKRFCSRDGKMVTGELKDNFLLVDLEMVMFGSYSLTWTDAHLHRQLVTVLTGPVVESFDREFRTLYAASFPVADTWLAMQPLQKLEGECFQADIKNIRYKPHLSQTDFSHATSPPPADVIVDWEALGVTQYRSSQENELNLWDDLLHNLSPLLENKMAVEEKLWPTRKDFQLQESKIQWSNLEVPPPMEDQTICRNTSSEWEHQQYLNRGERPFAWRLNHELFWDKEPEIRDECPSTLSGQGFTLKSKKEKVPEQVVNPEIDINHGINKHVPKRPIIVTIMENKSSDFINVTNLHHRTHPELMTDSKSLQDLSHHDERYSGYQSLTFSNSPMRQTPALALMRQRKDESKLGGIRAPRTFLDTSRTRSSSMSAVRDWKWFLENPGQGTEEK